MPNPQSMLCSARSTVLPSTSFARCIDEISLNSTAVGGPHPVRRQGCGKPDLAAAEPHDSASESLIHAGKKTDGEYRGSKDRLGAILGEVTITGCVTESESEWFDGPYGFTLENPVAYEEPKGSLAFSPSTRERSDGNGINNGRHKLRIRGRSGGCRRSNPDRSARGDGDRGRRDCLPSLQGGCLGMAKVHGQMTPPLSMLARLYWEAMQSIREPGFSGKGAAVAFLKTQGRELIYPKLALLCRRALSGMKTYP